MNWDRGRRGRGWVSEGSLTRATGLQSGCRAAPAPPGQQHSKTPQRGSAAVLLLFRKIIGGTGIYTDQWLICKHRVHITGRAIVKDIRIFHVRSTVRTRQRQRTSAPGTPAVGQMAPGYENA